MDCFVRSAPRNDGEPIRTLSSSRRRPGPITTDVSCWMELQPQPRITRTSVVMGPGSRCACPGRRGVCCASSQFDFQTASSKRAFATSRRDAPELCIYLSPPGGRGECRVPAAPAASCALCIGKKHTSNNEYTGTPGIPARNGFNGLCRALPGDRALLPPSSRGYLACPHPVGPTCLPQNLTPASGRQDHTILPSAATSLVSALFDRSQVFRLALRSHRAKNAAASTASRPYVRDDRETPLCVGRDAQSSRRDLGGAKTEIFLQRGLDTPVNKPPDGQITGLRREQIPRVSRARRSTFRQRS